MRLKGIKRGAFMKVYSEQKDRQIIGVVTSLSGDSIDNNSYWFDVNIHWLEPIQGNDSRFHACGSYCYKEIIDQGVTKV